jgi:hypothetical protein
MLGIDVNVNVKKVQFPLYFDYERNNVCVHCGASDSLVMVNVFGKEVSEEVYPFDHLKCRSCGQKYSIKWDTDEGSSKKRPYAADPSIARQFSNFFMKKIDKVLGK